VDAESHEEARSIVPPPYRSQALVVKLNKFTMAEIDEIMRHQSGTGTSLARSSEGGCGLSNGTTTAKTLLPVKKGNQHRNAALTRQVH